jgi:UDP-N-acetyl-D-mannosaminuronate dehydrogenase
MNSGIVGIIGCGHVGNSLLETFSKKFTTYGYDINQ